MFVCARKDQSGSYEKRERESGLSFEKVLCPQMTYCGPDSFIHVMLLPMTHAYQIGGSSCMCARDGDEQQSIRKTAIIENENICGTLLFYI